MQKYRLFISIRDSKGILYIFWNFSQRMAENAGIALATTEPIEVTANVITTSDPYVSDQGYHIPPDNIQKQDFKESATQVKLRSSSQDLRRIFAGSP
jgi:hypothetical protein